jgi:DNA replicative helicase MCM subunit Mcm2 (Cdc46/Mcm family)
VSQLEFEDKPKKVRYAVIVCPKCKQHAQITEVGKKTLSCQCCGALLNALKLRVFHFSEELADAVDFRTCLQAEISGKGIETFSLNPSKKQDEISKFENKGVEKTPELSELRSSENLGFKKNHKSIFLELLEASGGTMVIKELQQKALEKGISQEKFDLILKKCQDSGELYSPSAGIIKLV